MMNNYNDSWKRDTERRLLRLEKYEEQQYAEYRTIKIICTTIAFCITMMCFSCGRSHFIPLKDVDCQVSFVHKVE